MRAPSAAEMLQAWERGEAEPMAARALRLLALADTGMDRERLAALSIGCRDALLLELRMRLFGTDVVGGSACPHCGLEVEAVFRADAMLAAGTDDIATEHAIEIDGATVRFRLPDSRDLLALTTDSDADPRRSLLERCVLAVERDGDCAQASTLSDALADAVERAMAIADQQADIELAFTCPACTHGWDATFDIARYLWREIRAWAHRTLRDVHALARAYHWRETDILALSARRRQIYLELCRA